ncbi:MAG TPA: hypothetical protein VKS21_11250 [Spirochaetota bacterium]|nr:hypothetical protein [Spirochaetota bacterium]
MKTNSNKIVLTAVFLMILLASLSSQPQENCRKPKVQIDEKKITEIREIRSRYFKDIEKKKIKIQEKKLEIKKVLLDEYDMDKLKDLTYDMHKIMAELQIIEFSIDAEIKEILTDAEFHRYIQHRQKMKKMRRFGHAPGKSKRH